MGRYIYTMRRSRMVYLGIFHEALAEWNILFHIVLTTILYLYVYHFFREKKSKNFGARNLLV